MSKLPLTNEHGEVRDLSSEMDHFKPAAEVLADVLPKAVYEEMFQKRGRGLQKAPTKELVSLRLSPEVLDAYRANGRGWQVRIDEDLKDLINKKKSKVKSPRHVKQDKLRPVTHHPTRR